jgi:hypothetical protein
MSIGGAGDRFRHTIERVQDEAKQQREREEAAAWQSHMATLPTTEWWKELRDETIRPILEAAAMALVSLSIPSTTMHKNGGSGIILQGPPDGTIHTHLTFTLSGEEILVESSSLGLNEKWDRKYVTVDTVIEKVDQFVEQVAGYEAPPSGPPSVVRLPFGRFRS